MKNRARVSGRTGSTSAGQLPVGEPAVWPFARLTCISITSGAKRGMYRSSSVRAAATMMKVLQRPPASMISRGDRVAGLLDEARHRMAAARIGIARQDVAEIGVGLLRLQARAARACSALRSMRTSASQQVRDSARLPRARSDRRAAGPPAPANPWPGCAAASKECRCRCRDCAAARSGCRVRAPRAATGTRSTTRDAAGRRWCRRGPARPDRWARAIASSSRECPVSEQYCFGTEVPQGLVVNARSRLPSPPASTRDQTCRASGTVASLLETDVIVVACWRRPVNTRQSLRVPWNRIGRTCVLPRLRPSETGAVDFGS